MFAITPSQLLTVAHICAARSYPVTVHYDGPNNLIKVDVWNGLGTTTIVGVRGAKHAGRHLARWPPLSLAPDASPDLIMHTLLPHTAYPLTSLCTLLLPQDKNIMTYPRLGKVVCDSYTDTTWGPSRLKRTPGTSNNGVVDAVSVGGWVAGRG